MNQPSTKGVNIPDLQTFLKAGVQFGHETRRWNPRMKKFIYGTKGNVHIIDVSQTVSLLQDALKFLSEASRRGPVLFVGTKRQSAEIIKQEAVRAGSYFVNNRWAGGLLTNFTGISKSLKRILSLEEMFDNGVEGRTKYEVSKMKKEWERLNRIYGGVKGMTRYPSAVIVVDPRYEIGAVSEARHLNIPIVAITDTNCNPDEIDYVVPANDDAVKSLKLLLGLFADAVLLGNGGQGVRHNDKDYTKMEVKIIKTELKKEVVESPKVSGESQPKFRVHVAQEVVKSKSDAKPVVKHDPKNQPKPVVKKVAKDSKPKKELSARTQKALESAGLTVAKAEKMTKEELMAVKGVGESAIKEILG